MMLLAVLVVVIEKIQTMELEMVMFLVFVIVGVQMVDVFLF